MATELQQHAEGRNRGDIHQGLVPKELAFNVDPESQEAIYRKLQGAAPDDDSSFLHFPSQERLGRSGSAAVSGAGLIGVYGGNFGKINGANPDLQSVLQAIDSAIEQGSLQLQFNDNGINPDDIGSGREYFSQFTSGEAGGNHEVVGYSRLTEVLGQSANPPSGDNWIVEETGWAFGGGAVFTGSGSGLGVTARLRLDDTPPVLQPNRWYKFTYTISARTGSPTAAITTDFVTGSNVPLDLEDIGGAKTVYTKSNTGPVLKIQGTGPGGSAFTISSVTLAEITGGNVCVHGKITGGGENGIRIDGRGTVGIDQGIVIGNGTEIKKIEIRRHLTDNVSLSNPFITKELVRTIQTGSTPIFAHVCWESDNNFSNSTRFFSLEARVIGANVQIWATRLHDMVSITFNPIIYSVEIIYG